MKGNSIGKAQYFFISSFLVHYISYVNTKIKDRISTISPKLDSNLFIYSIFSLFYHLNPWNCQTIFKGLPSSIDSLTKKIFFLRDVLLVYYYLMLYNIATIFIFTLIFRSRYKHGKLQKNKRRKSHNRLRVNDTNNRSE